MDIDAALAITAGAVATGILVWLVARRRLITLEQQLRDHGENMRELEQQLQLQRRDALEDSNRQQLKHHEELREARIAAFEEGRTLGQVEHKSDHITELTTLRASHAEELARARDRAAAETREQMRAEFELRTKLFDVKISPYVEIVDLETYFKKEEEVRIGYQYQLLANGVPAFEPHVIIEKVGRRKKGKDENVDKLVEAAQKTVETAIGTVLGGKGKVITVGKEVVKRIGDAKKLLPKRTGK